MTHCAFGELPPSPSPQKEVGISSSSCAPGLCRALMAPVGLSSGRERAAWAGDQRNDLLS